MNILKNLEQKFNLKSDWYSQFYEYKTDLRLYKIDRGFITLIEFPKWIKELPIQIDHPQIKQKLISWGKSKNTKHGLLSILNPTETKNTWYSEDNGTLMVYEFSENNKELIIYYYPEKNQSIEQIKDYE